MKKIKWIMVTILVPLMLTHCGSSNVQTNSNPNGNKIQLNAFSLGSDFPSDIVIWDSTAFVVTMAPALGVVAIDLDDLSISKIYHGFDAAEAGLDSVLGLPRQLKIISSEDAFLLGSNGLIYFNPTTGLGYQAVELNVEFGLDQPLKLSQEVNGQNTIDGKFKPTFPDSMAIIGNRLFISMNNLIFPEEGSSYFVQGMVLVFDLDDQFPFVKLSDPSYLVIDGFNVTALTPDGNHFWVTTTGATELFQGGQKPLTSSSLTKINSEDLEVLKTVPLGMVVANYQPLAIATTGRAWLGSAAYSEVYEVDLETGEVIHGEENPIVLSDLESDFITDQVLDEKSNRLYVSSYNNNFVRVIDTAKSSGEILDDIFDFSMEPNPGLTGAGPMALGSNEILWVLTSTPGTVSSLSLE